MNKNLCLLSFVTCILLSCATGKNLLEPRVENLDAQKIGEQHRIVYGQYSPPDLDIKTFKKIFGDKISSWKKIPGGFSGAKLYQVDTEDHHYIVRSMGGMFGKAGIEQEAALMQQVSELGKAPKIFFADRKNGVVAMDKIATILPNLFAPGLLEAWPDLLTEIAAAIREVHSIKPDPKIVTNRYMDVYFYQLVKHVNKNILPPAELAIIEKFSTKRWPRGKEVLSHNDIHPRNFLHDGSKLYLIDWEVAGFGPEFYDVAMFANMQAMSNEGGREFLNLYLQRQASSNEYAEFVAMRQLQAMTFAIFYLLSAKKSENYELKALHKSSAPQTIRNFLFAFDSGLLDIKNPNHLYENALAQLRYANYFN